MPSRLISALNLSGAAITTAYTPGAAQAVGQASSAVVSGRATTVGGSASTSAELRLEGSLDGVAGWEPLGVLDLQAAAPAIALQVSKATGVSQVKGLAFQFDAGMPYVRVSGKWTGGAGIAGESLVASLLLR